MNMSLLARVILLPLLHIIPALATPFPAIVYGTFLAPSGSDYILGSTTHALDTNGNPNSTACYQDCTTLDSAFTQTCLSFAVGTRGSPLPPTLPCVSFTLNADAVFNLLLYQGNVTDIFGPVPPDYPVWYLIEREWWASKVYEETRTFSSAAPTTSTEPPLTTTIPWVPPITTGAAQCVMSLGQEACGPVCCSSTQFCYSPGICTESPTPTIVPTTTYSPPVRPSIYCGANNQYICAQGEGCFTADSTAFCSPTPTAAGDASDVITATSTVSGIAPVRPSTGADVTATSALGSISGTNTPPGTSASSLGVRWKRSAAMMKFGGSILAFLLGLLL